MFRRTGAVGAMTAAALAVTATGAQANEKQFSVSLSPAESQVSPTQEFVATIRNLSPQHRLGSVDLAAPQNALAGTGFDLRSVRTSAGTAALDGEVAELRDLSLAPGGALRVTLVADTTSTAGAWTWGAAAKQANDFNGVGNDLTLVDSQLTTVVTAPEGVSVPCAEEPVGTTRTCRLTVTWQGVGPLPTGDQPLGVPATGDRARAAAAPGPGETTYAVTMAVDAVPTLPTNAGVLNATLPTTNGIDCPILGEVSPVTGLVSGPLNREKTTSFTVDAGVDLAGPAPSICYAGPTPSVPNPRYPLPGQPQQFGANVFTPFALADCLAPTHVATACTSSRQNIGGNQVTVVETPGTIPDPAYRG